MDLVSASAADFEHAAGCPLADARLADRVTISLEEGAEACPTCGGRWLRPPWLPAAPAASPSGPAAAAAAAAQQPYSTQQHSQAKSAAPSEGGQQQAAAYPCQTSVVPAIAAAVTTTATVPKPAAVVHTDHPQVMVGCLI